MWPAVCIVFGNSHSLFQGCCLFRGIPILYAPMHCLGAVKSERGRMGGRERGRRERQEEERGERGRGCVCV